MNQSEIEEITHEATEQTPALTDYRYTGANPNYYVYFGCDTNCTKDNLYRIIGVIPTQATEDGPYENRVKLIKANYYTETSSGLLKDTHASSPAPGEKGYQWNSSVNNNWEDSTLNTQVLNKVYWNSLGDNQKYIESAKWYLGAINGNLYQLTVDNHYTKERGDIHSKSGGKLSYISNIGLMYPSDYGYSLPGEKNNEKWSKEYQADNKENYQTNAWLYQLENKYYEWFLGNVADSNSILAATILNDGMVSGTSAYYSSHIFGVRPTFYLSANVLYSKGDGSISNPYRLGL